MHTVESPGFAVHKVMPVADLNSCCKTQGAESTQDTEKPRQRTSQCRTKFHLRSPGSTLRKVWRRTTALAGLSKSRPLPMLTQVNYVPSDTHPPRQVLAVPKDWIGTCLSPSSEARPGWHACRTTRFLNELHSWRLNVTANSLQELYVEQLQDLYSAEEQIIKALPKMIEAAQSDELRSALKEHLEVTRKQASRIETICQELGEDAQNEKCKGMEGVLKEGSDLLKEVSKEVRDAAIIAAAQRVEHYEMAGYGTARTYATLLGFSEAASMLEQTLEEEKEADQTLSELTEELNVEALEAGENTKQVAEQGSNRGTRAKKSVARGKRAA